jgi:hypothetical protein
MNAKISKSLFYKLSLTWGLPMTLIGLIVAGVLMAAGYKPKKWNYCYYFEVGEHWGGLNLGLIFITCKSSSDYTRNHEHGHGIQNCYLGFLMPFMVCIPSAVRYWYRELKYSRKGKTPPTTYDSIWFEGSATKLGTDLNNWLKEV